MTSLGRGRRGMERQRYSSYGAVDRTKIAKLIWQQQALAAESEFLRRGKQSSSFLPCSTAVNDASKAAIAALGNVMILLLLFLQKQSLEHYDRSRPSYTQKKDG
jgi:hypothetical protein